MSAMQDIKPQPGPQTKILQTTADIALYGGSAGCGKSWSILLEALRHVTGNPEFGAVFFRRTTVQVKNMGGLWDESMKLYPLCGGKPTAHVLEWNWDGGGKIKFAHLEHETTKLDWQGSQIPLICFDELTHFTRGQFFYMLSRNRSMCGVRPYVRATCNPDADSWVADFIAWWIDEDGFAIPERSGIIRWFVVINDVVLWADSKEDLVKKYGREDLPVDHEEQVQPKSFTFIPGKLTDNQKLMKADPGYLANLKALPMVDQARLLGGNWKIRPAAGLFFKREWVQVVDAVPAGNMDEVRYWDLASTEKTELNDPDWTAGVKLARHRETGIYYWLHCVLARDTPLTVKMTVKNTATQDGIQVRIGMPQDPGQAGKSQVQDFVTYMSGYNLTARAERGDKVVRFGPFSAQCQAGNVKVVRGAWNEDAFVQLEAFPSKAHDDVVDACSGAFGMLNSNETGFLDYYRMLAEEAAKESQSGNGFSFQDYR